MGYDGSLKFDTKVDESGFNSGVKKLGTIAKSGLAVLGAGVAGFVAVTKSAVDEVAQLEQNVGGIETLFGAGGQSLEEYAKSVGKSTKSAKKDYEMLMEAQELALENANNAYKTAGMSANDYMSTVTSFAAALKQSVSDEVEAAKAADQAIIDMSDNTNKMGTSMESIQNAYQGFAKQNYTMLDNLKLGYGGTKEEMQRLLADAQKLTGIKYDINNLADVYEAIHVIQTELGITGTTAKEAATTIEGSMASAKAAWSNFLAGTGTPEQLVEAIGTAANVLVENLGEIVPRLADTIPKLAEQLLPVVLKAGGTLAEAGLSVLGDLVEGIYEKGPDMIESGSNMLANFLAGIGERLPELVPKAFELIALLAGSLIDNMPMIIDAGVSMIKGLIQGIVNSLPTLISEGPRLINEFCSSIYDVIGEVIKLGLNLIVSLVKGLWDNRGLILENAGQIFLAFLNIFSLSKLFSLGKSLLTNLTSGIKSLASNPLQALKDIFSKAINAVKNLDWKTLGKNILNGIVNGIKNNVANIISALVGAAQSALSSVKKFLGIKSPSTLFRDEVGKYMAQGIGVGFDKNMPVDDMTGALNDSVKKMQKKVSTVTQDAGVQTADRISKVYVQGDTGEEGGVNVQVVVNAEMDGTPLVVKTTKATIKKIEGMKKDTNKSKGK